jgi:hypothetical protein
MYGVPHCKKAHGGTGLLEIAMELQINVRDESRHMMYQCRNL